MKKESPLKEKHLLVVDDEPDVLEFVGEALDKCLIDKAANYETARQYIQNYTYDIVILDILGVNARVWPQGCPNIYLLFLFPCL